MRGHLQVLAETLSGLSHRDGSLIESTTGLCPHCLARLDAQILDSGGRVYIRRHCPTHGLQVDLLEEEADYFRVRQQFATPPTGFPAQTSVRNECPFDCGLCPNHQQHTCIALVEITGDCDLRCPVCYADARGAPALSRQTFERMLDFAVASEGGSLDILQLSGGEPALHPELAEFISLALAKGVKNVMLNTNGLALAARPDLLGRLRQFKSGFELYYQFDGLSEAAHERLRGHPLLQPKLRALERFSQWEIPVTLVMSVAKGVNDHELGALIVKALNTHFVRGVSFQPVAWFGRIPPDHIDRARRATLSGIIARVESQMNGMIPREHLIPLPCDPDRVAVGYFRKTGQGLFAPLLSRADALANLDQVKNTLRFSPEDFLQKRATGSCCGGLGGKLMSCFPPSLFRSGTPAEKSRHVSETTFRVTITSFLDACNFDLRSCQRECVHVITPDLKKIPFSAYNLYHRHRRALEVGPAVGSASS